ncbi:MAG: EamA/RhaT family transporter [Bacteroidetes bacterium]|nr:MAG: EamA/RhaT family transporter [Bacteroidota bacterium]
MSATRRAYLELNFAVLLFGLTAILGDLISLSAVVLVWWRVLLTSLSLLKVVNWHHLLHELPRRVLWQLAGIGVLVALHWLTFFGAIKLANASIALICFATTAVFTAFLEPLILRQRIKGYEIFLGLLVIPGMVLVVQNTRWDMMAGMAVGLLSAFLASLFGTLNKRLISRTDPLNITFVELSSAWLFLCPILPAYLYLNPGEAFWPTWSDWKYLFVLAWLCTTVGYWLAVRALRHLSAFATNLTINLEPIYGILLAIWILGEHKELSPRFYLGGGLILLTIFTYPFLRRRFAAKTLPKGS